MLDYINMKEIWKTVLGYEYYQVSNKGRVRSLRNNNIYYLNPMLRGYPGQKYKCVRLSNELGHKVFAVHRLVASYFVPNPHNFPVVNHKDEDKLNNNSNNLEWCTQQYNCTYNNVHLKRGKSLMNRKDLSKPVDMYLLDGTFIRSFKSLRDAGRFINRPNNVSDIAHCCNGYKNNGIPVHVAYGYKWKWKL